MPENSATKTLVAQVKRFWHCWQNLSACQKWGVFALIALVLFILVCREHIAIIIGYNNTDEMSAGVRFIRDIAILCAGIFGLFLATRRSNALDKQANAANDQARAANDQAGAANMQARAANEQAKLANQQFELTNERLYSDQFASAAEAMSKENKSGKALIAARTGGIYIMADLATKHPKAFAERVVKNIIAYIKDNAKKTSTLPPAKGEMPARVRILGEDVKAAFSVLHDILGNKKIKEEYIDDKFLDFSYQDFSGLYFGGIDLQYYKNWEETNFGGCFLASAHFADGANMLGVDFSGAWLREAIFSKANLTVADFRGAMLVRANMRGVDLSGADMQGCFMRYAELQQADNGQKTNLLEAKLNGANLMGASLGRALIYKTDMRGAVLSSGTNLTGIEQLIDARFGETYMINAKIEESVKSKLSKWAKSAGINIWLDHDDVAEQVNDPANKIDWRLKEYTDGYALAGVLANFAEAPSFEIFWNTLYSHFREEQENIQRQAAELDLEKLPKNTPKEIRAWLKDNKAKYAKE